MVAAFDRLFGTADGEALQKWCASAGWPLAWAHNPIDSMWDCNPAGDPPCELPPPRDFAYGVDNANGAHLRCRKLSNEPSFGLRNSGRRGLTRFRMSVIAL